MNTALRTAATGMFAQQINIDTIANNLANVNTTGFEKSRPEFQDLMYQTLQTADTTQNTNIKQPVEIQIGNGVSPVATQKMFKQGDIQPTQNQLDVAIAGEGFLQVRRADGTLAYTRDGALKISGDGSLVTSQGYAVEPRITLPSETIEISISREGTIETRSTGETELTKIGQMELVKFVNPAGLHAIGGNLYVESPASGTPVVGSPTTEGFGELQQGYLESSNVDVVEEMINMITAQRAYEINAKTIKTIEDMLSIANNVKQ